MFKLSVFSPHVNLTKVFTRVCYFFNMNCVHFSDYVCNFKELSPFHWTTAFWWPKTQLHKNYSFVTSVDFTSYREDIFIFVDRTSLNIYFGTCQNSCHFTHSRWCLDKNEIFMTRTWNPFKSKSSLWYMYSCLWKALSLKMMEETPWNTCTWFYSNFISGITWTCHCNKHPKITVINSMI